MTHDDPLIRRRADGAIDHDHYDGSARRLRARDLRAAFTRVMARFTEVPRGRQGTPPAGRAAAGAASLLEAGETIAAPLPGKRAAGLIAAMVAGLALGALAAQAGDADPQGPLLAVPLPVLAAAVTGWVAAELGEPIPSEMPQIVFVDRVTMHALAHADGILPTADTSSDSAVLALYRSDNQTIFLTTGWRVATAAHVSILVHEVVHHFQALRGETYACPAAREKLAYEVQERWLAAHGESLEGALGVEPLFRLVVTNCFFPRRIRHHRPARWRSGPGGRRSRSTTPAAPRPAGPRSMAGASVARVHAAFRRPLQTSAAIAR